MIAKSNVTVGTVQYQFEIDEKEEMETLHKIIVISNPPRYCNVCKKRENFLHFSSNKDKEGNTYVNVRCGCGATAKLGQYKAGGYFWHTFELYRKVVEESEETEEI